MNTHKDNTGIIFTTSHGQAPVGPQPVTVWNNGLPSTATWNGHQVVKP